MKKAWHQNFKRSPKAERTIDGITFDSKAEMHRWMQLKIMEHTGLVRNLQRQVKHELILPNGQPILSETGRVCFYTSDFEYERVLGTFPTEEGGLFAVEHIIEDVKGHVDPLSRFRIAVFTAISRKTVHLFQV